MKIAFQKIIVAICLIVLNLAACIIGMYLLFNTSMEFKFHIAYTFVFMGALVFSILAVLLMFKRPPKKAEKDEVESVTVSDAAVLPEEKEKHSLFGKKKDEPKLEEPVLPEEDMPAMNFDPDIGEPLTEEVDV